MKTEIIAQLNSSIGEPLVSDIYFKQGSLQNLQEEKAATAYRRRVLTESEKQQLAELAAPVSDPELRAALMSLCSSQLADPPRSAKS
jgi:hypothetical protein